MQSILENIALVKKQIEDQRQFGEDGLEFWSARDLAPILGYRNWEQVPGLVERASAAAENAGSASQSHFRPASKMAPIGGGNTRKMLDFQMSRYGCYLFAMNGDPRKPEISCAQSYFVVKTHQMEAVERQAMEDQQARALPATVPALPAPVGMDFLQQFAGNVLVAIQQQAHTTKEEVKAEIRSEITQTLGEWPISGSQPREIHRRVGKLAKLMGGQRAHFSDAWRRLKDRYEVIGYRDLTVSQFDDAVKFLDLQIASYQTDGGLFRGGRMNPRAQIEAVNALIACGKDASALALYREYYDFMARDILARATQSNALVKIPGVTYLDLYIGKSEYLRAYKVGISKDAHQRAKSIRTSNAAQGDGSDFELLHIGCGPARLARDAEKRLKDNHAALAVKGTEWISFIAEDFLDTCWIEQDKLMDVWWRQMCGYDPLADLDRKFAFYGSLFGASISNQLSHMSQSVRDWDRTFRELDASLKQVRA